MSKRCRSRMDLQEKNVLVIGSAGRVDCEIVRSLISRKVGKLAMISCCKEDSHLTEVAKKVDFELRHAFAENKEELKKAMDELSILVGGFDIIINSVLHVYERSMPSEITNIYNGAVNSTLIGIELMRKDKGGRGGQIINVISAASLAHSIINPVYVGAKHAVLSFTKSLHNDSFYEKTGIAFISVLPGITKPIDPADYEKLFLFPELFEEFENLTSGISVQEPGMVGKCLLEAIDDNENGAVWRVENSHIEKIQLHEYPRF